MKRDTMIKYAAVAVVKLLCLATSRVYGQVSVGLSAMDHSYWTISEGTGWLPDGSEVQVGDFPGLTPAQVSTLAGMTGPMIMSTSLKPKPMRCWPPSRR